MKKLLALLLLISIFASCKDDDDNSNNCGLPADLTAAQVNSTSVQLVWEPNEETAFELEYGIDSFVRGTGTVIQTSQTSIFIEDLEPSTAYDVYLRSNCGSQGFSNYIDTGFTTLEPVVVCNKPTDLNLIEFTSSTIRFSWSENNETAWEIEYGTVGFPLGNGTTAQTSNSNFEITGLNPGTTYEIYVRANCGADGFSQYSDPLVVTTDP